jgi:hypothetical protein
VTELNSPHADQPKFVTRDGCTLYFSVFFYDSQYPQGVLSQYVAERPAR